MNRGTIRCARRSCGKERTGPVCPHCGNASCYVTIYWKGNHYKFRRFQDGMVLDYNRARDLHATMRFQINHNSFNPADWLPVTYKERKFSTQIEQWLAWKKDQADANELSHETVRGYRSYVTIHMLPYFEKWDVREIRLEQLSGFCDFLRPRVGKIKTRRHVLNALHNFFDWMFHKGAILQVPAWPVIKGDDSDERKALDEDAQDFGLANTPERHRDVLEFGMRIGRRPGELCALQVQDLEAAQERVKICRAWSGPRLRETTKGGKKGNKYAALDPRALAIAEKHSRDKLPGAFLFLNPDTGRAYRPRTLNNLWKEFSGLPGTVYYEASRHSFCTQLGQIEGVTLADQQEAMGHAAKQSTLKYIHKSVKRLSDILRKKAEMRDIQKAARKRNEK